MPGLPHYGAAALSFVEIISVEIILLKSFYELEAGVMMGSYPDSKRHSLTARGFSRQLSSLKSCLFY